ncbi:MAG: DUF3137 domain-containing protein [Elusimicrobia bacterium]|nr:DUF3137 domain-containing protein [Elusimicrobiota bacterium]
MRTSEEFYNFFNTELVPALAPHEEVRKKALQQIWTWWAMIGGLSLVLLLIFRNIQVLFFTVVIGWIVQYWSTRQFRGDFKADILTRIVHFISPGLSYNKDSGISQKEFEYSRLFLQGIDEYDREDQVQGRIGETRLRFSEVHAKYVTHDSKGHRTEHTIFRGLFFIADFNKNFPGRTYVLADTAENLLGGVGTWLQSQDRSRGELVKLEDPDFEKLFAVFSSDQVEARYILSTSFMARLVDFRKKAGRQISLAFLDNRIYVALAYSRDLFEPNVFRTLLDYSAIKSYFDDLTFVLSMVEDLNLNVRIWGK